MLVRNTKYERSFLVFFPPPTPKFLQENKRRQAGNEEKWGKMGKEYYRAHLQNVFFIIILQHFF